MRVLTGTEVTPEFCAIRAALVANGCAATPDATLAVWCWHAGLTTLDEVRAELRAAGIPAHARHALINAPICM